jgi:hypothetical protein
MATQEHQALSGTVQGAENVSHSVSSFLGLGYGGWLPRRLALAGIDHDG